MPYEISFTKPVTLTDRDQYINECCVGGDIVASQLLPAIRDHYTDVQTNQEDWGWFIWFRDGNVKLAVDIFTDDPAQGAFRIHLTSRTKRFLVLDNVVDTLELEKLRALVTTELAAWAGNGIRTIRVDSNYGEENGEAAES